MPKAERIFWYEILNKQRTGYRFLRQKPVGNYIVDFYCRKLKLVIEIDGDSHLDSFKYDQMRTKFIEQQGFKVIRFTNNQVLCELELVRIKLRIELIKRHIELIINEPPQSPFSRGTKK